MTDRRVTFVCQWFPPEPAQQPLWIVQALEREGWDVSVLTGVPNYPTGVVAPGYQAARRYVETGQGRVVVRTPLYPSHDASAIRRIANYLSWALSATVLGGRAFAASDVSLVYSSPATSALPAMWQKLRRGTPYVLVIQDLWPDSIFASGFLNKPLLRRLVRPLVDVFVRASYAGAEEVIVISPGMKRLLESRGVPSDKISLVYNWVDEGLFNRQPESDILRNKLGLAKHALVVLYAGNHGAAQSLGPIIEGFVQRSDATHLVMLGDGVEKPKLQAFAAGAKNIHFLPPVPPEEAGRLMAGADALLVSLSNDRLFEITMPSKVQASLAAGRALLVSAPGDAAEVVDQSDAGVTCRPGHRQGLQTAIDRLWSVGPEGRALMGQRGANTYKQQMSQIVGARRLSDLLRRARSRHADHDLERVAP